MDKTDMNPPDSRVVMMNNKQVKENIGQVVQIHTFRKHDFIKWSSLSLLSLKYKR